MWITVLALLVSVSASAVSPATSAPGYTSGAVAPLSGPALRDSQRSWFASEDDGYLGHYGDPRAYEVLRWRYANREWRPYVNVAVAWLDITDLSEVTKQRLQSPWLSQAGRNWYEVLSVEELERRRPELYRALNVPDGVQSVLQVIAPNQPHQLHSEQVILQNWFETEFVMNRLLAGESFASIEPLLPSTNISSPRLLGGLSERQPCAEKCERLTRGFAYIAKYGTKAERKQATGKLGKLLRPAQRDMLWERHIPWLRELGEKVARLSESRGVAEAARLSPLAAIGPELAKPPQATGGIDFSSLELRYLADGGADKDEGVRFAFQAGAAPDRGLSVGGVEAAREASDAFFVWLALPPTSFTVNLGPDEPDRIVDAQLGRTDAGRILLEADLRLKKTTAALTHPDTDLGARYWASVRGDCRSSRTWITPGLARVRETAGELYILEAPLLVSTEADYVQGPDAALFGACPKQDEAIERHNIQVFRSMILPKIYEAVNEPPEYADLRRVYLSRVAAEWIRERSAKKKTAYSDIIDSGNVEPWLARQPWDPREVHSQYVKSFTDGEYNVTHRTEEKTDRGTIIRTQTYVSGGVDFTRAPRLDVGEASFQARWAHLPATVHDSLHQITLDADGQHLWVGGGAGSAGDQDGAGGGSGEEGPPARVVVILVAMAMLAIVVAVFFLVPIPVRNRAGP